jgi:hypothetical protein
VHSFVALVTGLALCFLLLYGANVVQEEVLVGQELALARGLPLVRAAL